MIKTVSFAPPRASGSRSSAKVSGAKTVPVETLRPVNPRAASGRTMSKTPKAPMQTSLELLFDAPDEVVAPATKIKAVKPAAKLEEPAPNAPKAEKAEAREVKAKRARVPKDLAAQYGEKAVTRAVAAPVEAEIAKKRLSKAERQARRDLIKPSEGLMERLARANQITARKPKAEPRGKGWKFVCGRCGTTSYFETPGGLCACGTIALKE